MTSIYYKIVDFPIYMRERERGWGEGGLIADKDSLVQLRCKQG